MTSMPFRWKLVHSREKNSIIYAINNRRRKDSTKFINDLSSIFKKLLKDTGLLEGGGGEY